MYLKHNPHSFLTGDDPFLQISPLEGTREGTAEEILFEPRHEGFVGIPHGGISMGLCLDAWRRIGSPSYPVSVRFRFGGSGITIGDRALFTVEEDRESSEPCVLGKITKPGDKTPYLRAEIRSAPDASRSVPVDNPLALDLRKLPYYRNCFVCGHHRIVPGLQRRFAVDQTNGGHLVSTGWGDVSDDGDRSKFFLFGKEELHPAVLISIFDENTAWAGFMLTRSAGLSVRVEFTLMRPVASHERLLFVSQPTGIRGNPKAPRFFLAEGTIFSVADPGRPEPVAYGKGEWVVMDQYTAQIKENLLPGNDWQWIFGKND